MHERHGSGGVADVIRISVVLLAASPAPGEGGVTVPQPSPDLLPGCGAEQPGSRGRVPGAAGPCGGDGVVRRRVGDRPPVQQPLPRPERQGGLSASRRWSRPGRCCGRADQLLLAHQRSGRWSGCGCRTARPSGVGPLSHARCRPGRGRTGGWPWCCDQSSRASGRSEPGGAVADGLPPWNWRVAVVLRSVAVRLRSLLARWGHV